MEVCFSSESLEDLTHVLKRIAMLDTKIVLMMVPPVPVNPLKLFTSSMRHTIRGSGNTLI